MTASVAAFGIILAFTLLVLFLSPFILSSRIGQEQDDYEEPLGRKRR